MGVSVVTNSSLRSVANGGVDGSPPAVTVAVADGLLNLAAGWRAGTPFDASSVSDGANTYDVKQRHIGSNTACVAVGAKSAVGAGSKTLTLTPVGTGNYYNYLDLVVRGHDTTKLIDSANVGTASAASAGTITASLPSNAPAGSLVVAVLVVDSSSSALGISTPSGWTQLGVQQDSNTYVGTWIGYKAIAAAQAVSVTLTFASSPESRLLLLVIPPAPGTPKQVIADFHPSMAGATGCEYVVSLPPGGSDYVHGAISFAGNGLAVPAQLVGGKARVTIDVPAGSSLAVGDSVRLLVRETSGTTPRTSGYVTGSVVGEASGVTVSEALNPLWWLSSANAFSAGASPQWRQTLLAGSLATAVPGVVDYLWLKSDAGVVDASDGVTKLSRVTDGSTGKPLIRIKLRKGQALDAFSTHRIQLGQNAIDSVQRIPLGTTVWIAYAVRTVGRKVYGAGQIMSVSTSRDGDSSIYHYLGGAGGNTLNISSWYNPTPDGQRAAALLEGAVANSGAPQDFYSASFAQDQWLYTVHKMKLHYDAAQSPLWQCWTALGTATPTLRVDKPGMPNAWNMPTTGHWARVRFGPYYYSAGNGDYSGWADLWNGAANGTDMPFDTPGCFVIPASANVAMTHTDLFAFLRSLTGE